MWKCAAPAWIKAEVRFGKWFSAGSLIEGLSVIGAGDVREPRKERAGHRLGHLAPLLCRGRWRAVLGVSRTKRGICVHKAGALCTQSGGFVAITPKSMSILPIGVCSAYP